MIQLLVQHIQAAQEVEFHMHGAGISLDINGKFLTGHSGIEELHLTVIHIGALGDLAIDKHQELRILGVVPLADLSADAHKDSLAIHALRNRDFGAEPIVFTMDTAEVTVITLELTFELVGAVVGSIPTHVGSKFFPGIFGSVSLFRTEELTLLILPVGNSKAICNAVSTQLIQDDLDALI